MISHSMGSLFVDLQLGFIIFAQLHALYESSLTLQFTDIWDPWRWWVLFWVFLQTGNSNCQGWWNETRKGPLLNVKFANKGIDSLNVSNSLNQKSVQNKIHPYFHYKESAFISYRYTHYAASNMHLQLQSKITATRLSRSFQGSSNLQLLWFTFSFHSMWQYSDRRFQYRT